VVALGGELRSLAQVTGTRVEADVAVLFDWHSWWALEMDSHPSKDVHLMTEVRSWHRALWEQGVTCDVVHPDADLGRYRLLLVPSLYLVTDAAAERIAQFVRDGRTVVVGWFSGIVDEHDHIRLGGYPGAFRELLGIHVEEFAPLLAGEQVTITGLGRDHQATLWAERGRATDAEVVATYADGPASGDPGVTRRSHSQGTAWYVGTHLESEGMKEVLGRAMGDAHIAPVLGLTTWPAGFDAVRRRGADGSYLFAVNHGNEPVRVPAEGTDLVTGHDWTMDATLAAGDLVVIRER
jgi:beta-galactosidase